MINKIILILIFISNMLYSNTHYSQEVLNKKIYPMGKKIFISKCKKDIDLSAYKSFDELQNKIIVNKQCKKIKGKKLEALSLYLWDIKLNQTTNTIVKTIKLKPKEKCPVCGMFVYKYPKWVAQILYTKNNHEHRLSFDGVKDMMKFYFEPKAWGKYEHINMKEISILVTDYYTQKPIDGFTAYYVLRSDVYGPMGHELIPFKNKKDATVFKIDHNAKSIITFKQITYDGIYELDE